MVEIRDHETGPVLKCPQAYYKFEKRNINGLYDVR